MNRIRESGWVTAIGAAKAMLPGRLPERLAHVDFACGVDPAYIGLYDGDLGAPAEGYIRGGMCVWRHSQTDLPVDRRQTTVVLAPELYDSEKVPVIVHELGHALHETIGWDHSAAAVSRYAEDDYFEAFAEAFRLWVIGYGPLADHYRDDEIHLPQYGSPDPATVALFERLAA